MVPRSLAAESCGLPTSSCCRGSELRSWRILTRMVRCGEDSSARCRTHPYRSHPLVEKKCDRPHRNPHPCSRYAGARVNIDLIVDIHHPADAAPTIIPFEWQPGMLLEAARRNCPARTPPPPLHAGPVKTRPIRSPSAGGGQLTAGFVARNCTRVSRNYSITSRQRVRTLLHCWYRCSFGKPDRVDKRERGAIPARAVGFYIPRAMTNHLYSPGGKLNVHSVFNRRE